MIRSVDNIPPGIPNRRKPSVNHQYFKLAVETPNDYLMIPCPSTYRAKTLANNLSTMNRSVYEKKFEVFKRDNVVYLKRKKDV